MPGFWRSRLKPTEGSTTLHRYAWSVRTENVRTRRWERDEISRDLRQGRLACISTAVAAGTDSVSSARRLRQNSVTPRCYPLEPGFGSGRTAERQVWEVLRDQLPADAALLHSVTMIERATEYEADLVVGWPGVGVAVIEVKGGHISRDQGRSCQSSGGETHPVKDPVAQAQDPGDWTAVRRTFRVGYVAPASWFRWSDRSACALVPSHDVSQAPGTGAVPPGGA